MSKDAQCNALNVVEACNRKPIAVAMQNTAEALYEQMMNASHPFPGAPMRRMRHAIEARLHSLEPRAARRFGTALVCLGASYALAWLEIPLAFLNAPDSARATSSLAAAITARVLIGVLYAFVALGRAWARWVTVVLCLLSVVLVGPLLSVEWRVLPLGALVTLLGLACKLAAAVLLVLPLSLRPDMPR